MNNLTYRENTLRLFTGLHQNDNPDCRRADGRIYCEYCYLMFKEHPIDTERHYFNDSGADHRLCNGDIVHL